MPYAIMTAVSFGVWPSAVATLAIRRLLALAAAYDMSRGSPDTHWAHRFNEEGPEGLKNRAGAGRRRLERQARVVGDR